MRTILPALALALALVARGATAPAQCSTGSCPPCTMCRVPPASGSNPSVAEMATLFDRIATGPASYGSLGWNFTTTIGTGPGCCDGGTCVSVRPVFPCLLLKAIYSTESNWRQFCTSGSGAGMTVISFDCGYGIAQVTSGMRRGETSSYDPDRVASSAAYNVSVGAQILATKWRATPCVGSNDPDVIESWYFATWAYNGLSFRNNPNNPMFRADRVEFRTPGNSAAQVRGNYPYQELVWGYAHYPPSTAHWTGLGLAYPVRSEICASCPSPTADISEPRGSHHSDCPGSPVPDAGRPDTGFPDTGRPDTGFPDTGRPDTGPSDTGAAPDRPAAADTGVPDDAGPATVHGSCGCTVPGGAGRGGAALVLLALVRATSWSRRRRRPARSGGCTPDA